MERIREGLDPPNVHTVGQPSASHYGISHLDESRLLSYQP